MYVVVVVMVVLVEYMYMHFVIIISQSKGTRLCMKCTCNMYTMYMCIHNSYICSVAYTCCDVVVDMIVISCQSKGLRGLSPVSLSLAYQTTLPYP